MAKAGVGGLCQDAEDVFRCVSKWLCLEDDITAVIPEIVDGDAISPKDAQARHRSALWTTAGGKSLVRILSGHVATC